MGKAVAMTGLRAAAAIGPRLFEMEATTGEAKRAKAAAMKRLANFLSEAAEHLDPRSITHMRLASEVLAPLTMGYVALADEAAAPSTQPGDGATLIEGEAMDLDLSMFRSSS